jgi:hypothetical protein
MLLCSPLAPQAEDEHCSVGAAEIVRLQEHPPWLLNLALRLETPTFGLLHQLVHMQDTNHAARSHLRLRKSNAVLAPLLTLALRLEEVVRLQQHQPQASHPSSQARNLPSALCIILSEYTTPTMLHALTSG